LRNRRANPHYEPVIWRAGLPRRWPFRHDANRHASDHQPARL